MIDNEKLRWRSPITRKAKSSMILEYSLAGRLLEVDERERGALITAILEYELYGVEEISNISKKGIGIYYAIISDLDFKGGEWLESCRRNQKNSPKST